MKKTFRLVGLMLLAVVSYGLTACGSNDDDDAGISVTPSNVSMYYEDTKQLKAEGATSWLSNDEFVAKVAQNGLLTGMHVGTTTIVASNGKSKGTCEVTITPKYSLFDMPLLNWGASKSSIESAEKHSKMDTSSDEFVLYDYSSGSTACLLMYSFENNRLKSAMALLNRSMYANAGFYLLERFQPIGLGDDDDAYFMDAMSRDKAKTVCMLDYYKLSGTTYTSILFADISVLSSSSSSTRSHSQLVTIPDEIKEYLGMLRVEMKE